MGIINLKCEGGRLRNTTKAKKYFCPRANTVNTHHGMRYAGEKLFSNASIQKLIKDSIQDHFHNKNSINYLQIFHLAQLKANTCYPLPSIL